VIDLYSDTLTRPTPDMRRFMCEAEVGDEQKGEDPTVNLLQEMVADLLGKEAAVYLPSGTMCNEIAVKVHTRPGDEVLADRTSHLIHFEGGGPGLLSGVLMSALDGERGVFTGAQVRRGAHPRSRYSPPTRLVSVENTSNLGGGRVWPLAAVEDVRRAARELAFGLVPVDENRVECPTLVVGAEWDQITPVGVQRRIAAKYDADYLEMAGHAHMLMLEEGGERPIKEILTWVDGAIGKGPRA